MKRVSENADETIYSYDYGSAHFIVLNTGGYSAQDKYLIEAQRDWLIKDLNDNSDAKWTVLLIHEPVYHRLGGDESRPWLYDVIENYGIDLVMQGHSHLVTRSYPMKNGEIVTKQNPDEIQKGSGTVYTTIGSTALNKDGEGDASHVEEMMLIAIPAAEQATYTIVNVTDDKLSVVTKQLNGLVLDSFSILADDDTTVIEKSNENIIAEMRGDMLVVDYESPCYVAYTDGMGDYTKITAEKNQSGAGYLFDVPQGSKIVIVVAGDISGDGVLDAIDKEAFEGAIFTTESLTPEESFAADVNRDGEVDTADLVLIAKSQLDENHPFHKDLEW